MELDQQVPDQNIHFPTGLGLNNPFKGKACWTDNKFTHNIDLLALIWTASSFIWTSINKLDRTRPVEIEKKLR